MPAGPCFSSSTSAYCSGATGRALSAARTVSVFSFQTNDGIFICFMVSFLRDSFSSNHSMESS